MDLPEGVRQLLVSRVHDKGALRRACRTLRQDTNLTTECLRWKGGEDAAPLEQLPAGLLQACSALLSLDVSKQRHLQSLVGCPV